MSFACFHVFASVFGCQQLVHWQHPHDLQISQLSNTLGLWPYSWTMSWAQQPQTRPLKAKDVFAKAVFFESTRCRKHPTCLPGGQPTDFAEAEGTLRDCPEVTGCNTVSWQNGLAIQRYIKLGFRAKRRYTEIFWILYSIYYINELQLIQFICAMALARYAVADLISCLEACGNADRARGSG